jgi:hypothetical protein
MRLPLSIESGGAANDSLCVVVCVNCVADPQYVGSEFFLLLNRCLENMIAMAILTKEGEFYLRWVAVGALLGLLVIKFANPHLEESKIRQTRKEMCEHDPPPRFPAHYMGWCK